MQHRLACDQNVQERRRAELPQITGLFADELSCAAALAKAEAPALPASPNGTTL